MNFRYDINGIRAIAVIAVVLFHFDPKWVPGGFAGVDVFFVISGFLMTGITFRALEAGKFNIFKFYVARANRIFPALVFLCLVLIIFGWYYLAPLDYRTLGKHVYSSLLFISNHTYFGEAGYFDSSSYEKWLLHTWSLSAEWQFYILYPLIIVVLKKFFSLDNLKKIIVVLTVLGFLFNVVATIKWPTSSYFLLPARAWEMMVGGVAFLYPLNISRRKKKLIELVGLSLIFSSFAFVSSDTPWPGHFALLPVLGGYLVILANQQTSAITNNVIFQHIGRWSYSIYLWHWPIVVLGYYLDISNWFLYGLPLSIVMGFISFTLIESYKFTIYEKWSDILKVKPLCMLLFIGLVGFLCKETKGFHFHYAEEVLAVNLEKRNRNPYGCIKRREGGEARLDHCYIGNTENLKAVIIGDSHADALTTSISSMLDLNQEGIIALNRASCPFIFNYKDRREGDIQGCYHENHLRLEDLNKYKGTPLVLIARWPSYIYGQSNPKRIRNNDNGPVMYFGENISMNEEELLVDFHAALVDTLCTLTEASPVIITQPVPEMRVNVPDTMSRNLMFGRETSVSISEDLYFERNSKIREVISDAASDCGAVVADPYEYLCKSGICIGEKDGLPIYYDGDHMSEFGNKILTPMFSNAFSLLH
ncbi:acyltransferase family protein [Vibrio sp. WXL210]|uniref:acyltransferase family protein n=1 Tax=Vibrio sp. WXL210 TaxID=3450709 RepID=UPI003EC5155F